AFVVADIGEQVAKREMEDRSDRILIAFGRAQIRADFLVPGDGSLLRDGGSRRSGRGCSVKPGLQKVSPAHELVRVAGIHRKRKRLRASGLRWGALEILVAMVENYREPFAPITPSQYDRANVKTGKRS